MEKIRFYISSNVNANIPIGMFANPDPNNNIGAVTKYQWDLTGLSFAGGNVTSISLPYRPTAGSVFTTFAYNGTISSFTQLLNILNGIGAGIFYREESGGYTYLAVSTQNYVYGNLTLLPALSYMFTVTADISITNGVSMSMTFTAPTDITINWDDGTTDTFLSQIGANTYSHTLSIVTGQQDYDIEVSISTVGGVTVLNLSASANIVELSSISALTALTTFNVAGNEIRSISPVASLVTNMNCSINRLTTSQVNDILILLDGYGLLTGTFDSSGQTPAAPPTGAGITAKNNLIGKGWTVTTD